MKRKKDVIKKAVLASVLAMSLNNVVWAAEGVDQPFSTVSELEALGGIASIDSSSISHVTKGIYASGNDFIYNSGAIKLGNSSHLYGDIERSFGADIQKKWQVNAGVRFEF